MPPSLAGFPYNCTPMSAGSLIYIHTQVSEDFSSGGTVGAELIRLGEAAGLGKKEMEFESGDSSAGRAGPPGLYPA